MNNEIHYLDFDVLILAVNIFINSMQSLLKELNILV
jgi:hypothetical protein